MTQPTWGTCRPSGACCKRRATGGERLGCPGRPGARPCGARGGGQARRCAGEEPSALQFQRTRENGGRGDGAQLWETPGRAGRETGVQVQLRHLAFVFSGNFCPSGCPLPQRSSLIVGGRAL